MAAKEGWGKERGEQQADVCVSPVQQGLGQGLSRPFLTELWFRGGRTEAQRANCLTGQGSQSFQVAAQHITNPGLALSVNTALPGGQKEEHKVFSQGHQERREGGEENPPGYRMPAMPSHGPRGSSHRKILLFPDSSHWWHLGRPAKQETSLHTSSAETYLGCWGVLE